MQTQAMTEARRARGDRGDAVKSKDVDWAAGNAVLYFLHPPLLVRGEDGPKLLKHVVVSAVDDPDSGPETLVFPSDADGNTDGQLEVVGSFRGACDHERALAYAGYRVVL